MGLFSFFKKKDKEEEQYDAILNFSQIKTDVHSHLLPGIDDGSPDMETTLSLINGLRELGFTKAITTPHIMSDSYRNTPAIINEVLAKVKQELIRLEINFSIEAAAEYYLDDDFLEKLKTEKLLTFSNNYLLFEISYINPPDYLSKVIFDIQSRGYKPVLAHPERYAYWLNNMQIYDQLKSQGVLFQLNTIALTGYYGGAPKKIAEQLIKKNYYEFIGSDMHKKAHLEALGRSVNEKLLHQLLYQGVSNALL
ncbi:MAG: hypothetical protein RIQ89_686 [Bacteroidota bacterium]|jgi:protein-tyrosine phosphatase